ncbi:MAG: hypothetical protein U1F35_09035 [Steroidobacteraceae bacterium]
MKSWTGAAALLLLAPLARAADGPYLSPTTDRVRITLGVMRSSTSTNLRVDTTSRNAIDWEAIASTTAARTRSSRR